MPTKGFMYSAAAGVRQDGSLSSRLKDVLRNRRHRAVHRGGSTEVRFQLNGGELAGYHPTAYEIVEGDIGLRAPRGAQPFATDSDLSGLSIIDL